MTQKEINKLQSKAIFKAVQDNFNLTRDFEDFEGHGYWSFAIEQDGIEFTFDMKRRSFDVCGYLTRGEENKEKQTELETAIEELIETTLSELEF